jgi:hypothetical protein
MEKKCKVCLQIKPFGEFKKNASSKDGYAYTCKACIPIEILGEESGFFGHIKLQYKKGIEHYLTGNVNGEYIDEIFPYDPTSNFQPYQIYRQLKSDCLYGKGNWQECGYCHEYKHNREFNANHYYYKKSHSDFCIPCKDKNAEDEKESRKKYNEKIAREGLFHNLYWDSKGKLWENVYIKNDGTVLKDGVVVSHHRSYENPYATSDQLDTNQYEIAIRQDRNHAMNQPREGFFRRIINAFKN